MSSTRTALRARQWYSLQTLLGKIQASGNRFYAEKFIQAGITTASIISLSDFSQRLPFTQKSELSVDQQLHPPYGRNQNEPLEHFTRFSQTSGSLGAPLRWPDTPESWAALLDQWQEIYLRAGVTRADRLFFAFSFGPFLGFWTAFEAAERLLAMRIPGGGMSTVARWRTLLDTEATVVLCTPTYALRMTEVAVQENIDTRASKVRLLIVAGEPGGAQPEVRKKIEKAWNGARVFDHHGMTETGPASFACPSRPDTLHILEEAFYPEIINLGSDGTGELVLTPLVRTAMPLLRYRTGDLVRALPSGSCGCGCEWLALDGGILGRTDDMAVVRGVNIYPAALDNLLRGCDAGTELAEYQIELYQSSTLAEIKVRLEPLPQVQDAIALAKKVEHALNAAFALRIPVELAAPGTLPRFEMKARRWVRK